ncbi:MAG: hypothetical protein HQM00_13495 [Magnetococcales bacterium]|nr:hypothetical protein [Magnetococcales bacterium]
MQLNDGRKGTSARVSNTGQLYTLSSVRKVAAEMSESGNAAVVNSGFITQTAGGEKGVLKIRLNPDETHIHEIRLSSDAAVKWRVFSKATSDTFSVAGTPVNLNLGSGTVFDCAVNVGDNVATVTGGTPILTGMSNSGKDCLFPLEGLLIGTAATTLYIVADGAATVMASVVLFKHDTADH